MNVESIRELYDYYFALNRRIWDEGVMALSDDQFITETDYSQGSVRNHIVHLVNVDTLWFARLNEMDAPESLAPEDFADRARLRFRWDQVEGMMRMYLAGLTPKRLDHAATYISQRRGRIQTPSWRILLHVVNHGTDHRAQILSLLHQFGAPTLEQDYMLYLWDQEDNA